MQGQRNLKIKEKISSEGFQEQHDYLTENGFTKLYLNYRALKDANGDKVQALAILTAQRDKKMERNSKRAAEAGFSEAFKNIAKATSFNLAAIVRALEEANGDEQKAVEELKRREEKKIEKAKRGEELQKKYQKELEQLGKLNASSERRTLKALELFKGDVDKCIEYLQGKKSHTHKSLEEMFEAEGFTKQLEELKARGVTNLKRALKLLRKFEGEVGKVLDAASRKEDKRKEKRGRWKHGRGCDRKSEEKKTKRTPEEIAKEKGILDQFNALKSQQAQCNEWKLLRTLRKHSGDLSKASSELNEEAPKLKAKGLKELAETHLRFYIDATNTFYSDRTIKRFLMRKGDFKLAENALIELMLLYAEARPLKSVHLFFENRAHREERKIELKSGSCFSLNVAENNQEKRTIPGATEKLATEELAEAVLVTPDRELVGQVSSLNMAFMKPRIFLELVRSLVGPEKFESLFSIN